KRSGPRPRRSRPRNKSIARRDERSRFGHVLSFEQADTWRLALSRARSLSSGSRGAERTRGATAPCTPSGTADAFHVATDTGAAIVAFVAVWPDPLRHTGCAQAVACLAHGRSYAPQSRPAVEADLSLRL